MLRAPLRPPPRSAGFTLVELVLSVTLVTMLMLAVMQAFQGFGQQLQVLRESEEKLRVEEGLLQLGHDVRSAWIVERPDADGLRVQDALGRVTEYWRAGSDLMVRRPSGAEGVLLSGVADLQIVTQTVERLRPDPPAVLAGTWWEEPTLPAADQMLTVEEALPVALGFTVDDDAPAGADVVPGVEERVLEVVLERLALTAAFAAPVDPASGTGSGGGGSCGKKNCKGKKCKNKGKGKGGCDEGGGKGGKHDDKPNKTTICHIPPGNPANAHTLSVGNPAVDAHLAHGDTLGPCGGSSSVPGYPPPSKSELVVELYEARAPNLGVPHGPLLASVTLPISALPVGTFRIEEFADTGSSGDSSGASKGGKKTVVCHIPPGNPANAHTISVGNSAVAAHLAHGDTLGACDDGSEGSTTRVVVFDVPTELAELDLGGLDAAIEPGRAHTLVLRLEGSGTLLLASDPLGSAVYSGVAKVESGTSGYEAVALGVPRQLSGAFQVSQTVAQDVIASVSLALTTSDGQQLERSAAVLAQSAIANPWLGAVPGELASLALAGQ